MDILVSISIGLALGAFIGIILYVLIMLSYVIFLIIKEFTFPKKKHAYIVTQDGNFIEVDYNDFRRVTEYFKPKEIEIDDEK